MTSTIPDVSIVIETENLATGGMQRFQRMLSRLPGDLDALNSAVEILVVHDGNRQQAQILRQVLTGADLSRERVSIISCQDGGYYAMKDAGAGEAQADVLVFLDADVIPEPGAVTSLARPVMRQETVAATGFVHIDECANLVERAASLAWVYPPSAAAPLRRGPARRLNANSFAIRRTALAQAGGFRSDTSQYRGQCAVLASRLTALGIRVVVDPAARFAHPPPTDRIRSWLHRGLWHGHDTAIGHTDPDAGVAAPSGARLLARELAAVVRNLAVHWRRPRYPAWQLPIALGLAVSYNAAAWVGFLLHRLVRWQPGARPAAT